MESVVFLEGVTAEKAEVRKHEIAVFASRAEIIIDVGAARGYGPARRGDDGARRFSDGRRDVTGDGAFGRGRRDANGDGGRYE
jgi:hypothetical protein